MTFQELIDNFKADLKRREALHAEQEQKKLDAVREVMEAEDAVKAAARNGDESAYHDAEARLSFKKACLAQLEIANVFWTRSELEEIARDMRDACCREQLEIAREVWEHLKKAEELEAKLDKLHGKYWQFTRTAFKFHRDIVYGSAYHAEKFPNQFMHSLALRVGEHHYS